MNNNKGELAFPYEIKDPADDVQEQFIKDFSGKLFIKQDLYELFKMI